MVRRLSALTVLLAGCLVDVDYSGSRYACGQGQSCPAGFTCGANGFCVAGGGGPDAPTGGTGGMSGSGGMAGTGGQAGGGGVTSNGCGKATAIADNFDDNMRSPLWDQMYSSAGAMVGETGGELVITLPDNVRGYGGYQTSTTVDLTNARVLVEVTQAGSTATHAQAYLQLDGTSNADELTIVQENGTLYFQKTAAGTTTDIGQVIYDPVVDRWWQIRESGGIVFFETSPDAANWTQHASTATPAWAPYSTIELGGGTYMTQAGNGSVHFDNLNGGTAADGWCAVATLVDDFNGAAPAPQWQNTYMDQQCPANQSGGFAILWPGANGADECAYVSATRFDLTGSAVYTWAYQVTRESSSTAYTFLELRAIDGDVLEMFETGGNMVASHRIGGAMAQVASVPYNGATHAWWRIREASGHVFYETSPDGTTWTLLGMESDPIAVNAMQLLLGAGTTTSTSNPGQGRFNVVNSTTP